VLAWGSEPHAWPCARVLFDALPLLPTAGFQVVLSAAPRSHRVSSSDRMFYEIDSLHALYASNLILVINDTV